MEEFLCKQTICKGSLKWSPTCWAPGTRKIVEDNFSMDSVGPGGGGEDMGSGFRIIQGYYIHCACYYYYYISTILNQDDSSILHSVHMVFRLLYQLYHQAIDLGMLGTHYRGSRKECLGRCWHQPYAGGS